METGRTAFDAPSERSGPDRPNDRPAQPLERPSAVHDAGAVRAPAARTNRSTGASRRAIRLVLTALHAAYALHVTLKIGAERSDSQSRSARQALADDVLDELTAWNPRDREGMFRTWHRGALSLIHLNVLTVLEVEGPLSMSQLAQALDVSDASATGIVDRMERRGFVERQHATDDRRQVRVHATDAGRSVFTGLHEQRRAHLSRVLAELSDDELSSFLTGVRAIRAARARVWAAEGRAAEGCAVEPSPADSRAADGRSADTSGAASTTPSTTREPIRR